MASADLPTPLSQFGNLPCLAPIIRAVDPDAPKNIGEALLLPPYRSLQPPEGIGKVSFPIAGTPGGAQTLFDRGVALLHGLDDLAAEQCFREAASQLPEHPMPYWGLALANERRPGRAAIYIEYAAHLAGNFEDLSAMERRWIEIYRDFLTDGKGGSDESETPRRLTRIAALEDLAYDYPDSVELRAFLLRELVLDQHRAGMAIGSRFAIDALARGLLEAAPNHPSAIYRPLLWLGSRPERAAAAAAGAVAAAPRSPAAWRVAAESFIASGDLGAALVAGDAATRIDLSGLAGDVLMPDERPDAIAGIAAHVETLIACGATRQAVSLARHLIALPRTADLDPRRDRPSDANRGAFRIGRRLMATALMSSGRWRDLQQECSTNGALKAPEDSLVDRSHTLYWKAIAEWQLADAEAARATGAELEGLFRRSLSIGVTREVEDEVTATIRSLRGYASLFAANPPAVPRSPLHHISPPQLARLLAERGALQPAIEISAAHLRANPTLPEAVAIHCALLAESGNIDQALPLFDSAFRRNASLADPDHLLFGDPMLPLAGRLGLRGNWRLPPNRGSAAVELPAPPPSDNRWAPTVAPPVDLPRPDGSALTTESLTGKPSVLIFFVGIGCAFCVEQLKIFQPHRAAFEATGIPIHTVTTDPLSTLEATAAAGGDGDGNTDAFPFPIAADPTLETFRRFRCFDSFNNKALHGIYLLSSDGRILWSNISHEPFLYPEFLLGEARRLTELWPRLEKESGD